VHKIEEGSVNKQSSTKVPDRQQSSPTISAQYNLKKEKVQIQERCKNQLGIFIGTRDYNLRALIGGLSDR
jgi:hypothetical protein